MAKDVFISHSSSDRAVAEAICDALEARGLRCWIAPRDIQTGQSWGASIVRALDECPVMVLVLTAQSNASRHVAREVERADGKRARLLNVRVQDVPLSKDLEYFLSADQAFDATRAPLESHLGALADAVRSLLDAAPRAARPPGQATESASRAEALQDSALVREFDELAPDDWNAAPGGKVSSFLRRLFADR